jgi:hypothetical protein
VIGSALLNDAAARFLYQPLRISLRGGRVSHAMRSRIQQRLNRRAGLLCQSVVYPKAALLPDDDSGTAEVRQMTRGFRLGNAEALMQMAYAHLALTQEPDDPKPRWIGQSFEQCVRRFEVPVHICLDKYTVSPSGCLHSLWRI